jgi:Fe-S-cluster containining protein
VPSSVVMTAEEAAELRRAKPGVGIWIDKGRWVELVAGPCPFYDREQKACTVYAVRPVNCRRYGCYRVGGERFVEGPVPVRVLRSPALTAQYLTGQEQAMTEWGRDHGWSER